MRKINMINTVKEMRRKRKGTLRKQRNRVEEGIREIVKSLKYLMKYHIILTSQVC